MKPRTVLLVEDEIALHDAIKPYFEREGIALVSAFDGETGRRLAIEGNVDLVILDVMLPGVDGFEVLKEIRRAWNVPVIMLTARSDEIDRLLGLEAGADDYVTKPFSPRELVARVKAVYRRAAATAGGAAKGEASALRVDADAREVSIGETVLPLTRSEYLILARLASRPGRVYTRAELLHELEGEYEVLDRTIDAHVKNIRRKIAEAGGDPTVVETVRGFGYRLRRDA